jgi:AcrR family transcriptional regulator
MSDNDGPDDRTPGRRLRPGPGQDPEFVAADQRRRLQRAMTELVYEVGYSEVTLAKLLPRARVTKPTYYRLFGGKEDCFAAAYSQAADEAIRWTADATLGSRTREELFERGFDAFCGVFSNRPAAATLALVAPVSVGDDARRRRLVSEAEFARLVRTRFTELEKPVDLPATLASAVILGGARAARRRLEGGEPDRFREDARELTRWAMDVTDIESFSRFLHSELAATAPRSKAPGKPPAMPGDGERVMLVNAALRLGSERGYEALDIAQILAATGLSRRVFDAHFDGLDGCFAAACELGFLGAASQIRNAYREGPPGPSGVARSISALTGYLAANPATARLIFVDVFRPGRRIVRRGAGLLSGFAGLLRERVLGETALSDPGAEAAVGAIWNLIQRQVERGNVRRLPRLDPTFAWLVLAGWWEEPVRCPEPESERPTGVRNQANRDVCNTAS